MTIWEKVDFCNSSPVATLRYLLVTCVLNFSVVNFFQMSGEERRAYKILNATSERIWPHCTLQCCSWPSYFYLAYPAWTLDPSIVHFPTLLVLLHAYCIHYQFIIRAKQWAIHKLLGIFRTFTQIIKKKWQSSSWTCWTIEFSLTLLSTYYWRSVKFKMNLWGHCFFHNTNQKFKDFCPTLW